MSLLNLIMKLLSYPVCARKIIPLFSILLGLVFERPPELGEPVLAQRAYDVLKAIFLKALKNAFSQLVLHPILVDEFPDLADQSEAERNVAKTGLGSRRRGRHTLSDRRLLFPLTRSPMVRLTGRGFSPYLPTSHPEYDSVPMRSRRSTRQRRSRPLWPSRPYR